MKFGDEPLVNFSAISLFCVVYFVSSFISSEIICQIYALLTSIFERLYLCNTISLIVLLLECDQSPELDDSFCLEIVLWSFMFMWSYH